MLVPFTNGVMGKNDRCRAAWVKQKQMKMSLTKIDPRNYRLLTFKFKVDLMEVSSNFQSMLDGNLEPKNSAEHQFKVSLADDKPMHLASYRALQKNEAVECIQSLGEVAVFSKLDENKAL